MSLRMGYRYRPSADLLVLVCVSTFLFGITHTRLRITLEPVVLSTKSKHPIGNQYRIGHREVHKAFDEEEVVVVKLSRSVGVTSGHSKRKGPYGRRIPDKYFAHYWCWHTYLSSE